MLKDIKKEESLYVPPPAKLTAEWERKLGEFDLSEMQQLRAVESVTITTEDPSLPAWQKAAQRIVADEETKRMQLVPTRSYKREVPSWATDDSKVQEVLDYQFPKRAKSKIQKARADRWMYVIYEYFRAVVSTQEIADELKISNKAVTCAVGRIRKVGEHLFGVEAEEHVYEARQIVKDGVTIASLPSESQ